VIRITIIAAAVLLTLGGVAFAMSRPEVADPGPPVVLDSSPTGTATTPQAATGAFHDADEDEFQVATPRAVKADEDDWDDDDGIELDDDGGADREED